MFLLLRSSVRSLTDRIVYWMANNAKSFRYLLPDALELARGSISCPMTLKSRAHSQTLMVLLPLKKTVIGPSSETTNATL